MNPARLRQIEELFHAARECGPDERRRLLSQIAPELRSEIESLLAQSRESGTLALPAQDAAAALLEHHAPSALFDLQPAAESLPTNVGETVGQYRIVSKIGEGAMGVVYLAEQRHPRR